MDHAARPSLVPVRSCAGGLLLLLLLLLLPLLLPHQDVDACVRLEPRHFGAWSGRGLALMANQRHREATVSGSGSARTQPLFICMSGYLDAWIIVWMSG